MIAASTKNRLALAAVFAAYVLTGKLGLSLAYVHPSVSAVWAPTGIALAAFLIVGTRVWPAVLFGAFLVNVTVGATTVGSVLASLAIAGGNTLEGWVGAYAVTRFAGGCDAFRTARHVFRFAAVVVCVSTPISATCGVTALALVGSAHWADYGPLWATWWLGALAGGLVVTPIVMLWSTGPWRRHWTEVAEAVTLLVLLVPTALIVFGDLLPLPHKHYPLEFLCVPFFLWAAFRLGRREAAAVVAMLSVIAVWGSHRGYGPFVQDLPNESFLLLQAYTSMWAVVSVALAAVVAEQRQAEQRSRELAVTDPLTGLANYRRLNDVLTAEIARSARTGRPFSILFFDLNGLKKINDRYGHLSGNQALRRVADALRRSCRAMDTPARFGGDEFVAILPETDEEGGQVVARRVSDRVVADLTAKPPLSISTGVAEYPRDGVTPAMLLAAADGALYQVKAARPGPRRRSVAGGRR
jgi:diguanylate cyclase (GGDEF)-like protein